VLGEKAHAGESALSNIDGVRPSITDQRRAWAPSFSHARACANTSGCRASGRRRRAPRIGTDDRSSVADRRMTRSAAQASETIASNTAVTPRVPAVAAGDRDERRRTERPADRPDESNDRFLPMAAGKHRSRRQPPQRRRAETRASATTRSQATPSAVPRARRRMAVVLPGSHGQEFTPGLMLRGRSRRAELRCPRAVDEAMVDVTLNSPSEPTTCRRATTGRRPMRWMPRMPTSVVHERRHDRPSKLAGTGHVKRRAAQVLRRLAGTGPVASASTSARSSRDYARAASADGHDSPWSVCTATPRSERSR